MESLIGVSSFVIAVIIATMAFCTSARYHRLAKSFLFLGLAFLFYGVAELSWYIYDMHEIEPYQTPIDGLYIGYYIFGVLHIIYTLKAMRAGLVKLKDLLIGVPLTVAMIGAYLAFSYETDTFSLFYGLAFTTMASVLAIFSLTILVRIRKTALNRPWIFISTAILVASITDVWYYTQENVTGYGYGQYVIMDLIWLATDIIMILGIITHWKKM